MLRFLERTAAQDERAPGAGAAPRRYLWTDAFAVCNLLALARATGEARLREHALALVRDVHRVLGRFRPDDPRRGWISGLAEAEGEAHPTAGGLRIGKPLPERGPDEPFDERLEWERDGQYLHYLTRWMHALDQVTRATGDCLPNRRARELAVAAHRGFSAPGPGRPRLHWKMSTDLARPLVASMGQHDPLDGYVTCRQLRDTAATCPGAGSEPTLEHETARFRAMLDARLLATDDPLGIGGLLADAFRLAQLPPRDEADDEGLIEQVLAVALLGLDEYAAQPDLRLPAGRRLAFRELGLAIGLHAVEAMAAGVGARGARRAGALGRLLARLTAHAPLATLIETFWLEPASQAPPAWTEHRDINEVMLATALAPEGFLVLAPAPA